MTDNKSLEYTSYVSAYLAYFKLLDNVNDKTGIKRIFWKIISFFGKRPVKRIPDSLDEVKDVIDRNLHRISECEKNKCDSPSEPAEAFGNLLGFAMSYGLEENQRVVFELGKKVGMWVYLADALCDLEDDEKSGSYNPFLLSMGFEKAKAFRKTEAEGILGAELKDAYNAFLLGPDQPNEAYGCIRNILQKGMMNSYRKFIQTTEKKDVQKPI